PDPVTLPLRDLALELTVGRWYLREVEVRDWQTRLAVKDGTVRLDPLALSLNGAPVKGGGSIQLSVPGYRYDLNLRADAVPMTPLVDSFLPERKGQLGGTAGLRLDLRGAGLTGASLRQNLSGQYEASMTNLNLSVGNVQSAVLRTVLNVVLALPELIRNPGAAVGSLVGRLVGGAPGSAGWVHQFSAAPIEAITLAGRAGGGVVELQQARVLSAAFDLRSQGIVRLNPVLTNSTLELPVQVALRTNLAATLGAKPTGGGPYAALPDFLQVTGTVGAPKSKIDYPKLALLGGQALLGGAVEGAGSTAKGVVEGLKNLVGGGGAAPTAPGAALPAGKAPTNRLEAV
ncbi:MAG: AsmA family protein, partial [Verrucomicrobiota bacterium]